MRTLRITLDRCQRALEYISVALTAMMLQLSIVKFLELLRVGFYIKNLESAILFISILGLANSFLLIPLISQSLKKQLYLIPLSLFLMNGVLIWLIGSFVPDIFIPNIWIGILLLAAISISSIAVCGLYIIDDQEGYERFVVRPLIQHFSDSEKTDVPGIIFLEIDGLSENLLRSAMDKGYVPTLKRWLESGSHKLTGWDTDLSSESASSQAGILQGSNYNIPAYSWYDKDIGRLFYAVNPKDAADTEKRISNGRGLLARRGASRSNIYSGDAPDCLLTCSTVLSPKRYRSAEYFLLFAHAYMICRALAIFIAHLMTEYFYGWLQVARNELPRIDRGGTYPFMRAASTAILRELTVFSLIGDMLRGIPSIYATLEGYDTVAHHSGIARKDTMEALSGIDNMISWLESFSAFAARPYRFVVHSDHGQCQGATFLQRSGRSLEEMVAELTGKQTASPLSRDYQKWNRISLQLTEFSEQNSNAGRLLNLAFKKRMADDVLMLGPEGQHSAIMRSGISREDAEAIVIGSGNLGLIYFTSWKKRMSLEQIDEAFPKLIPGLLSCEYIGFILVRSEVHGPMAIGAHGIYYLQKDRVEGTNPLACYGPLAAERLRRESGFTNVADIVVNSFYSHETEEIAAFEELVGSHGGLGGDQSLGCLMYPSDLDLGRYSIIGAEQLHRVMEQWVPNEQLVPCNRIIPKDRMVHNCRTKNPSLQKI